MNPRIRFAAVLALGTVVGLGPGCRPGPTGPTRTNAGKTNEDKTGEWSKGGGEAGPTDNSFRLTDIATVELRQGGSKAFEVSIYRGPGFRSEVKFSLQPLTPREAKGITFAPADWMLNSNESSRQVTARAEKDSAVGTFSWNLIIRPRVGQIQTRTLTVVVGPKG